MSAGGTVDQTKASLRLFSERIQDRHRRWWIEKQPHPYKSLGGKLQGRAFAQELGIKVPKLHALVDRARDIPSFDELPRQFVLKPVRGWSARNVFLMKDGLNTLDGTSWDRAKIVRKIVSDESQDAMSSKIMIEEYLRNWDLKPGAPLDYKFYLFGKEIAFIHVIERNSGSNNALNRHWFMTESWEPIKRRIVRTQTPQDQAIEKPDCIEELYEAVSVVGSQLQMFMRLDMYATDRGAVFGEFTPQPHGGKGFTGWADLWLGSLWQGLEGTQTE